MTRSCAHVNLSHSKIFFLRITPQISRIQREIQYVTNKLYLKNTLINFWTNEDMIYNCKANISGTGRNLIEV